jgi:hypothetical protein
MEKMIPFHTNPYFSFELEIRREELAPPIEEPEFHEVRGLEFAIGRKPLRGKSHFKSL